jgi:hypothetical protein
VAEGQPPATANPLLRGLFGSLQQAAASHLDTASIWSSLRSTSGSWLFQAQGRAQPFDPVEVEQAGRQILSAQGVNAATVSSFRGVAGSWLQAKTRLQGLDQQAQITSSEVFTAPWARTASGAVPSRYAIRTQWQFETSAGETATVWKHDELEGALTTVADALTQARSSPLPQSPPVWQMATTPPELTDFEIEQI